MKRFLRTFSLMAFLMMAVVQSASAATLTYDFMSKHPSSTIRIDQGYKEIRDGKAYWTGAWAGLFGNKIAFDGSNAYYSLSGSGGLVDYHDHQKLYVMNLSAGDKVTFYYSGTNAAMQFHISSTARMQTLTANFDPITSGTAYAVAGAGDLCVLNKWTKDQAVTIINRIVIETANDTESVDVSHGLCTYCSANPLDFSHNSNLRAYIATGYNDGKFIFKEVSYVPSNTGFLIVSKGGSASSATVQIGRSSNYKENAFSNNLFEGALTGSVRVVIPSGKAAYMFGVADGKVGIYRTASAFTCAANKAFLVVNE